MARSGWSRATRSSEASSVSRPGRSSPAPGSSSRSSRGRETSARAISARLRSPSEQSPKRRSPIAPRPNVPRSSSARSMSRPESRSSKYPIVAVAPVRTTWRPSGAGRSGRRRADRRTRSTLAAVRRRCAPSSRRGSRRGPGSGSRPLRRARGAWSCRPRSGRGAPSARRSRPPRRSRRGSASRVPLAACQRQTRTSSTSAARPLDPAVGDPARLID